VAPDWSGRGRDGDGDWRDGHWGGVVVKEGLGRGAEGNLLVMVVGARLTLPSAS
jgi:hypothetical protein